MKAWIEAHPRSLREGARFLANNIKLIDQPTLEQNLFSAVSQFKSENPSAEAVFVVHETGVINKSGSVMMGAVLDHFPELRGQPVFSDRELGRLKAYIDAHPNAKAVIVDDAAHKGTQLHSVMESVSQKIGKEKVVAALGYATKSAVQKCSKFGKVYFGANIPTIGELVAADKSKSLTKSIEQLATESSRYLSPVYLYDNTLILFENSSVDTHSFPHFLKDGIVPVHNLFGFDSGRKKAIQFIHAQKASYKNLPYVSPSSVFTNGE